MAVWRNRQTTAPRYRGQLDDPLPSAFRPRAIVYQAVHGTSGQQFWLFPKQVWNNCILLPRGAVDSSMHYCPRPKGRGQWCIELSTVPKGNRFVYSAKQPWNNSFITQPMLKIPVFSPRNASLIGTRRRYTRFTLWRSTLFSWCLMSSTRQ